MLKSKGELTLVSQTDLVIRVGFYVTIRVRLFVSFCREKIHFIHPFSRER